ncbi:hypothetical protein B0H12DRAFT_1068913 [Mycena haematopus]|nr:hypothetical protein B0H12DRAFT_1068913 [Mycena haematopus]
MFRLWLGLKALALARIWRLWLLKIPGQAAPSRLGLAWAGFGLSRGFCRNFGIIIDCSNTTTPSSLGLPPVAVPTGRRHPSNGCRARPLFHRDFYIGKDMLSCTPYIFPGSKQPVYCLCWVLGNFRH